MTIRPYASSRKIRFPALLVLVALLLSGCIKGMIEGDRDRSILRPDIIKYTTTTDTPRPKVKEVVPEPAGEGVPTPPRGAASRRLRPWSRGSSRKNSLPAPRMT